MPVRNVRTRETAVAPPATACFIWDVPDKPISIYLSLDLIDRLERAVIESFKSLTKRGSEVGGILLGRIARTDKRTVFVENCEPVTCDYSRGHLYLLSDPDKDQLRQALQRLKSGPLSVVGFFRSNSRKDLAFDQDEDVAVAQEFFSDPNCVFLLVKPFSMKPSAAGFFLWEDGSIPAESPLQFPFRRSELQKLFPESIVQPGEDKSAAPAAPAPVTREERAGPVVVPKREERPPLAPPPALQREEPKPRPVAVPPKREEPPVARREEPAPPPVIPPKREERPAMAPPPPKREEPPTPPAPPVSFKREERPAIAPPPPKREEPSAPPVSFKREERPVLPPPARQEPPAPPVSFRREEWPAPLPTRSQERPAPPPILPKREERPVPPPILPATRGEPSAPPKPEEPAPLSSQREQRVARTTLAPGAGSQSQPAPMDGSIEELKAELFSERVVTSARRLGLRLTNDDVMAALGGVANLYLERALDGETDSLEVQVDRGLVSQLAPRTSIIIEIENCTGLDAAASTKLLTAAEVVLEQALSSGGDLQRIRLTGFGILERRHSECWLTYTDPAGLHYADLLL